MKPNLPRESHSLLVNRAYLEGELHALRFTIKWYNLVSDGSTEFLKVKLG